MLHTAEHAFWTDDGAPARPAADLQPFFNAARAGIVPRAKRTCLISRTGGAVILGLTALPLPDHTPGHTGYRVTSDGRDLLIWGDILHAPAL